MSANTCPAKFSVSVSYFMLQKQKSHTDGPLRANADNLHVHVYCNITVCCDAIVGLITDHKGHVELQYTIGTALQAATTLVAMASGKNIWRLKFWQKSPIGDLQI